MGLAGFGKAKKRKTRCKKKEMPISEQGVISRGLTKTKEDNKALVETQVPTFFEDVVN